VHLTLHCSVNDLFYFLFHVDAHFTQPQVEHNRGRRSKTSRWCIKRKQSECIWLFIV